MRVIVPLMVFALLAPLAGAQADADGDGIDDALEQALLERFLPAFQIGAGECAAQPARFDAGSITPRPVERDGTIYGQVSPGPRGDGELELHFHHLWNVDCGAASHPLDAEHVSALVRVGAASATGSPAGGWTATHWYAAAHEDTACDSSHGARAVSLGATTHGPVVWISEGKHASFLAPDVCAKACGADRCDRAVPLDVASVVNLGEPGAPLNGADWIASGAWPLAEKLGTDFGPEVLARLDATEDGDIVTVAPGTPMRHFASNTARGLSQGRRKTGKALWRGFGAVGAALGLAGDGPENEPADAGR